MRYLPLTDQDRDDMLQTIGAASMDDLFVDVPASARGVNFDHLPNHQGELEVERTLTHLANKNMRAGSSPFFIGAGAYWHHVPASVDHLIQRSEFLTSYTPYQPEISQGTLQVLFEFQTQVAMLTGMEVANASMYDGSTAAAEAVKMAMRITRRNKIMLSGSLHPHYRDTIVTNEAHTNSELELCPHDMRGTEDLISGVSKDTAAIVVQTPSVFGGLIDLEQIAKAAHEQGALLIVVVTEIVSLGAVKSPGEMGADIVVAEGQSLGNGLNFGGPYVGLFATRQKYVRQMPGRVCGETTDADGKLGYVLTLSTREQHIRREKATSNICTNSGLCALAFSIHLSLLGEKGLRQLAKLNHQSAVKLANALEEIDGVELVTPNFFNEFTIALPKNARRVANALADRDVLGGVRASRLFPECGGIGRYLIVAATEMNTDEDRDAYVRALKEVLR
jgi:glycine cleavage system P protein (glycine dehydrogenase) subunit 1